MKGRLLRIAAWLLLVSAAGLGAGSSWIYLNAVQTHSCPACAAVGVVPMLVLYAVIGTLIVNRLPSNRIGWLMLLFPTVGLVGTIAEAGHLAGLLSRADNVGIHSLTDVVVPSLIALFFLYFPNGRLPSPRWKSIFVLVLVAAVAGIASAVTEKLEWLRAPVSALFLLLIFGSAMSLVFRWRVSSGVERQQLRLVAWAGAFLAIDILLGATMEAVGFTGSIFDLVSGVMFLAGTTGLALAIGVAVLRYRLYDIDRLISRTLVYAVLIGLLAGVYAGGVFAVQAILPASGDLAVAASTLAVAALFSPLRRRVQRWVDRRFYRSRYDAQRVVEGFSARLRDEVDLGAITVELAGVVRDTVRPASVAVWVRETR